jgi:succinate dehydrogenase subunit C
VREASPGPKYPVYVPKPSPGWWLSERGYRRFAAREFTSVFAAAYSVILVLFLFAVSRGRQAYDGFVQWLRLPGVLLLHIVVLAAMLYHAGTWFRLTSQAVVVRVGRRVVPRGAMLGFLIGAWILVSAAVTYFYIWF